MAVSFDNKTTQRSSTLVTDYPENILLDPEINGRIDVTDINDLAADIEKNGQKTPVLIRKNDKGQPVLVYGHRRWRAVKLINERRAKAGQPLVQLEARYEKLDDLAAFIAAVAENRFRKDASPADDAHNIAVFQNRHKLSIEQIAGFYFPEAVSPDEKESALRWVKNRIAIQELAPEAEQALRKGEVKLTAAVQLSKLSKDKQKEVIEASKAKGEALKGKARLKVSSVKAASPVKGKKGPQAVPAKAPVASLPAKVQSSVYEAAERMASALDLWRTDATEKAEKAVIGAHDSYRKLVPLRKAARA